MDQLAIRNSLEKIKAEVEIALAALGPIAIQVQAGQSLQAALDQGGLIELEAGATFEGTFVARKPVTIIGNAATLHGLTGPAFIVEPGTTDISLNNLFGLSDGIQQVFLLGRNEADKQGTLDSVPRRITLRAVTVPTFRGKRAFECNAAEVLFDNCTANDIWTPTLQDSQGIWIGNSPGSVRVTDCDLSAGSEAFLVGGDPIKIPGMVSENIVVETSRLWRPLSWRTDGVKRAVKNLFEVKTGRNVTLRDSELNGSWADAQEGFGVMITPHSGGEIHNVVVENCDIRNVTGGLNLLGNEYARTEPETPNPTSGVVMRGCTVVTDRITYGGRGVFALIGGQPVDLTLENNIAIVDGTSSLLLYRGTIVKNGALVTGGPMERLSATGNYIVAGKYGFNLDGVGNAPLTQTIVNELTISGNTFADAASAFQKNRPDNTFLDRTTFDALFTDAANGDYTLKP